MAAELAAQPVVRIDPELDDDERETLRQDLIGPYTEQELLDLPPSRFYLMGFLAPEAGRDPDDDAEGEDDLQQRAFGLQEIFANFVSGPIAARIASARPGRSA